VDSAVRLGLATVLLLLPGFTHADVLVSASGDRLKGRLVERRDGMLVFESQLLGRVEVSAEQAVIEPDPVSADSADDPDAASVPVKAAAPPEVRPPGWSSDVGVRLSVDRGSLETPEDDLRVSVKSRRPTPNGVISTGIEYRHKLTDDVLKDDDWDIEMGYQRFFGADHFVAGRLLAQRALTSEGYEETQAALVAAGWRWWEAKDQHLRVGPALGYLNARRHQGHLDAPALGLYATAEGQAWARVRFSSELVLLDTLGDGRYANVELRLRQPLGDRLYLALVWDYAWSDFDIEPGVRSEWRWDLGWRFGPDAAR
jgi:hypothetical protein